MPSTINWTVNADIAGGPSFRKTGSVEVEAYEKIDVQVAAGDSDKEVLVGPAGGGISFLLLRIDQPTGQLPPLTYKVNEDTADAVTLDAPVQLLIGTGAVGFLGSDPVERLFFTNTDAQVNATISILVGRDATP